MSEAIGGVTRAAMPQDGQSKLEGSGKQAGGRSFENVLHNNEANSVATQSGGGVAPVAESGVSGARLEQMRADLARDLDGIKPAGLRKDQLAPDFFDTRTRMGYLKEVIKSTGGTNRDIDLRGRFAKVESEWQNVEKIMASDKDLSTGELLGLQARMYQVSQHIEVMSKVVDQVTGGIKTILNTNV